LASPGGQKFPGTCWRDLGYRDEFMGVLAVWILLVCAVALDIAALLWGTLLSVVVLTVAALLAGVTLKMGERRS
jgi:hypothetical protein